MGRSLTLFVVLSLTANLPATEQGPVAPVPIVATPPAVVSLAAGNSHSLARRFDGTVWAWGANFNSQLGDGITTNRLVPTELVGFGSVAAVAAGLSHSLAVKDDGTIWTWGNPGSGAPGPRR